jgi:hypothetical protein
MQHSDGNLEREQRLQEATASWRARGDDLCYRHGTLLLQQIRGQVAYLERLLEYPPMADQASVSLQIKALFGVVDSFAAWACNFENGRIEPEPSQELMKCKF